MPTFRDAFIAPSTGHYSLSGITGEIRVASSDSCLLWYCRNGSDRMQAMVHRVQVEGMITTTAFSVGEIQFQLNIVREFAAEHSSPGGFPLDLRGTNNRLRVSMPSIDLAVIRIAREASLGQPNFALDPNPIGMLLTHSGSTPEIGEVNLPTEGVLFSADVSGGEYPVILKKDEGLVLYANVPDTGTWKASVNMKWAETRGISF